MTRNNDTPAPRLTANAERALLLGRVWRSDAETPALLAAACGGGFVDLSTQVDTLARLLDGADQRVMPPRSSGGGALRRHLRGGRVPAH